MIYGTKNSSVTFSITCIEGDTNLYPVIKIWDEDGDSEGTFAMSHVSDGLYLSNTWTPTINGYYHGMTVVYTDSGHTTESTLYGHSGALIKIDDIENDVTTIIGKLPTNYIMGSADQADWSDNITNIETDTNELQGDWTNGGRLDNILDELTTQGDTNEGKIDVIDSWVDLLIASTVTDALNDYDAPTKAELDTAETNIITEIDANETKIDIIDTYVDLLIASTVTDALNDYDAPTKTEMDTMETNLTTEIDANETKIDTIDGIVDNILIDTAAINWTNITDILTDTSAINWTNITDILTDTNELQGDWTNGGRLDLILDDLDSSVTFVYNVLGGKWEWTGTTWVFYEADNTTSVCSFDLYKADGTAASQGQDVYRRDRR